MAHSDQRPVYLWPDKLHVGDVILSNGGEPFSRLISFFDGGPYSHAQLVVGKDRVIEADGPGVDYRYLPSVLVERGDSRIRLFKIVSRHANVAVLRHPLLQYLQQAHVENAVNKTCERYLYDPYTRRWRLLGPMRLVWPIRAALTLAAKSIGSRQVKDRQFEGRFCSELVGLFFKELDLSLFRKPWAPHEVGPNDLCSTDCNLCVQDDVEADSSTFTVLQDYSPSIEDIERQDSMSRNLVDVKDATAGIAESNAKLKAMLDKYVLAVRSQGKLNFDASCSDVKKLIAVGFAMASAAGDDRSQRRVDYFTKDFEAHFPQARRLYSIDASDDELRAARVAREKLTKLQYAVARHALLGKLTQMRRLNTASCLARWKFTRFRRRRLREFSEFRRAHVAFQVDNAAENVAFPSAYRPV